MGFIVSPFLSPFAFGFLVARTRLVENSHTSFVVLTIRATAGGGHTGLDLFMASL